MPPAEPTSKAARYVKPVVKWAGGKGRLVDAILPYVPDRIGTYVEPFAGGAALFFALASAEKCRFNRAVLADVNEDLAALYRSIRDDLEPLIARLTRYNTEYFALGPEGRSEYFYSVRAVDSEAASDVERGARLVFLNRTCFNGLWRVNASGRFNVPFGRYAKPRILDESGLRSAHGLLKGVQIEVADFATVTRQLRPGDFAYFDPPYVPLSKTANFTAYAKVGFGPNDQQRLCDEFARLAKRGVRAVISNACSPETKALYTAYVVKEIHASRLINSAPHKRGSVRELVVVNCPRGSL